MSYGSPGSYAGSPAGSPAPFDAPSPSINLSTGRPLSGKGSRGPYKKRKKDGTVDARPTSSGGRSTTGGPHTPGGDFDEFEDETGFSLGGGGGSSSARRPSSRRDSVASVDVGRASRGDTPGTRRPGTAGGTGPGTPAATPGPTGAADDEDDEEDVVDDEDELNRLDGGEGADGEDQSEVRRRIQRVKEDQILLTEHMSDAQRERFDAWKVASFNRQAVKRQITQSTSNTITDDMAQIIGGVAKVYVGQVMSIARRVQHEKGDLGPLAPAHLREAYRIMSAQSTGLSGRAVGTGKKRKMFMR